MQSLRICGMLFAVSLLASSIAMGQVEIFELPVPVQQQRPVEAEEAPRTTSFTEQEAVSIKLNDTGIADLRFTNPRKPQSVAATSVIEFENQTADRTFEVTTSLAIAPGTLVPDTLPATVPLLIYDALTLGEERPPARPAETITEYEKNLIQSARSRFERFADILGEVLELEMALRERAARVADETQRRSTLLGLKPGQPVTPEPMAKVDDIESAQEAYETAKKQREAADKQVAELTGQEAENPAEYLAQRRTPLIDELTARATEKRKQRSKRSVGFNEKQELSKQIALLDAAVDALKTQSDETSLLVPLRLAIPSIRLNDCTVAAGAATCTAEIHVYPNGTSFFPYEVLLYQADQSGPARFNIKFFEEEETPARQVAYLIARERVGTTGPPKSVTTLMAAASIGAAYDPAIQDKSDVSRNCPLLCNNKLYTDEKREHFSGVGRIDVTQTFGNLFDGKVSIGFKEADLGGGTGTTDVKLLQYRFNLYSQPGWTLHYGKFPFSAPSFGIAINESGEGARLAYFNYSLAAIVKRESATGVADDKDRDHDVFIFEAQNIALTKWLPNLPLRTLSVIYLMGDDRKGPTEQKDQNDIKETIFSGHEYRTYGGQIGFTVPRFFYGSLSGYRSEREADENDAPCGLFLKVCDGEGDVGLLTITRPFAIDEEGKSKRTVTLTLGLGDGDDPTTLTEDEGYIGETAGYAPDQIFLSSFAGAISTRDFFDQEQYTDKQAFRDLDIGAVLGVGRGLANKRYLGVKVVDNSFSLLELIATSFLKIPKADIRSRATTVTFNDYRLRRPLSGLHDAGQELDLEFNVETPRSVKVVLKGGYYWRGDAVKPFIRKDVWTLSTGISLSL